MKIRFILAVSLFFLLSIPCFAREVGILVWANATNEERFRTEAIKFAASILNEELKIEGRNIEVTVDEQRWYGKGGWQQFKQAFSLAAEAGEGPDIVVSGHEDIPVWGRAGFIQPIEDLVDLRKWPFSSIYNNLWKVAIWKGITWGVPQDAEARPFFGWIPHLKAIGYTDQEIDKLPGRIKSGQYTLYDALEDAKKMQDTGLVQKGYGFYPRPKNGPDYWQFYAAFGGDITDGKGNLVLEREALLKYYRFFHDAVFKYGVVSKNHIGTDTAKWYKDVSSGRVGMWHGGTWHYARMTGVEGLTDFFDKVFFSLIPSGIRGSSGLTLTHPLVYLVSKNAKDEKAYLAARLIEIASEPRINTLHAISSAHIAISKVQPEIELYANDRWTSEATELLQSAISLPNNPHFGQLDQIVWKGLTAAWSGQYKPEKAVDTVLTEIRNTMSDKVEIR